MSVRTDVGTDVVRRWARSLPRHGAVLELGCGHGVPISQTLLDEGVRLHGIDASPTLIASFRGRFPLNPVECNAVENSEFFRRTFDGIIAWGLMFLLVPATQELILRKASRALDADGKFLFTAPERSCEWVDALTGHRSVSLGAETYCRTLAAEGLTVVQQGGDEGDNHYFVAVKKL